MLTACGLSQVAISAERDGPVLLRHDGELVAAAANGRCWPGRAGRTPVRGDRARLPARRARTGCSTRAARPWRSSRSPTRSTGSCAEQELQPGVHQGPVGHHVVDLIGLLRAFARGDGAAQPAAGVGAVHRVERHQRVVVRRLLGFRAQAGPLATQASLILPPRPWSISTDTACGRSP